jgi:hypothetical protein
LPPKPGSSPSFPPKWLVDFILGVEAAKPDIAEHSFIEPSELEPTDSALAPFTQRRTQGCQKATQPVRKCLPLRPRWIRSGQQDEARDNSVFVVGLQARTILVDR